MGLLVPFHGPARYGPIPMRFPRWSDMAPCRPNRLISWRSLRDSNPCYSLERHVNPALDRVSSPRLLRTLPARMAAMAIPHSAATGAACGWRGRRCRRRSPRRPPQPVAAHEAALALARPLIYHRAMQHGPARDAIGRRPRRVRSAVPAPGCPDRGDSDPGQPPHLLEGEGV